MQCGGPSLPAKSRSVRLSQLAHNIARRKTVRLSSAVMRPTVERESMAGIVQPKPVNQGKISTLRTTAQHTVLCFVIVALLLLVGTSVFTSPSLVEDDPDDNYLIYLPLISKMCSSGTIIDIGERPCANLLVENLAPGDQVTWDLYRYHDDDNDGDPTNDVDASGSGMSVFLDAHGHIGGYFVMKATITHVGGSTDVQTKTIELIPTKARVMQEMRYGSLTGEYIDDLWETGNITARIQRFNSLVGKGPSVAFAYIGWDTDIQPNHLKEIIQNGSIPWLNWDAKLWDPDPALTEWITLTEIITGTYDSFIQRNMAILREAKYPIFISFNHEFDGPWVPNAFGKPELYRQAYEHIMGMAPDNIIWVFGPNDQSWDPDNLTDSYYPQGIDLYAPSVYNWGVVNPDSGWRDPMEMLASVASDHARIAPGVLFGLGEFGSTNEGPGCKIVWIGQFPEAAKYYELAIINLFDLDKETGWSLTTPPEFADAYRQAIGEDPFFSGFLLYPQEGSFGFRGVNGISGRGGDPCNTIYLPSVQHGR